jgi:lysophospholipid acyltransferase (LPLAT)-like uncharacterized protein
MTLQMSFEPESSASTPPRSGKDGIVVPHRLRWYQSIGVWLVVALIRLVSATLRFRWQDDSGFLNHGQGSAAIFAVWHNRLALSMSAYYGYVWKFSRTPGLAALVSASKDGGFLAAILECFKVQAARGSSSRRGAQALLELTTWAERGFDLAITPDGPRGPRYRVQEGVMSLAQVSGLPIIPFSCFMRWKLQVGSWDRFQIPLPFSRCEMKFGKPVRVPRDATDAQREALRQELENALQSLSRD